MWGVPTPGTVEIAREPLKNRRHMPEGGSFRLIATSCLELRELRRAPYRELYAADFWSYKSISGEIALRQDCQTARRQIRRAGAGAVRRRRRMNRNHRRPVAKNQRRQRWACGSRNDTLIRVFSPPPRRNDISLVRWLDGNKAVIMSSLILSRFFG